MKHTTAMQVQACKFIEEILQPYIKKVIGPEYLPVDQKSLVIMDVFKGEDQVTPMILNLYKESNIVVVLVPANMTNFLQPLDLTVNGYVKKFMRGKFNAWYSLQIGNQLDAGKQLQDIDVPLRLSLLKPYHAEWSIECYNHMTTTATQDVIPSGWKAAGITEAPQFGVKGLGPLDPFQEIDLLIEREGDENSAIFNATEADIAVLKSKYSVDTQHDCDSGSDSEWENGDETDFERNAFDAFDDEPDL